MGGGGGVSVMWLRHNCFQRRFKNTGSLLQESGFQGPGVDTARLGAQGRPRPLTHDLGGGTEVWSSRPGGLLCPGWRSHFIQRRYQSSASLLVEVQFETMNVVLFIYLYCKYNISRT